MSAALHATRHADLAPTLCPACSVPTPPAHPSLAHKHGRPLSEDPSIDPVNLHLQAQATPYLDVFEKLTRRMPGAPSSGLPRRLIYVQRTGRNEAFFLAQREMPFAGDSLGAADLSQATRPWLLYYSGGDCAGGVLVPPVSQRCVHLPFMLRTILAGTSDELECTVCLEPMSLSDNPSQLPCMHVVCASCAGRMWLEQPEVGLTCPTCKEHHARHACVPHPDVPGGISLVEIVSDRTMELLARDREHVEGGLL